MPLVSFYDRYINYSAEVVAKKVETFSTFEKRKNSLTNHITKKLSYDTNQHGIAQSNIWKWKKLIKKPLTIHIEQIFRCYLKTT